MFYKIKIFIFHLCKMLGLFWISRVIYKKDLRILCYHGFTLKKEHEFLPGLFIEPEVFAQRMQYLADKKYKVITLQEAYELKEARNFPDDGIVITIDDGFYSVLKSLPILKKHNFPATLYVTSYYFDKNAPIFMLAVKYMFFKTTANNASLKRLEIDGLSSQEDKDAVKKIINRGFALKNEDERVLLLRRLGECLDIDYDELNDSRILNLINGSEIEEFLKNDVDIQLHTHRHTFPEIAEVAAKEIQQNKDKINPLLPYDMDHFCYPSGVWSEKQWPVLEQNKILTATTCEPRLVNYDTPNLALDRILDSTRVSQIEFEAEVSGFNQIIRLLRNK